GGAMTQNMPTEILGKISPEDVLNIQTSEKQIVSENWLSLYNERLVRDKVVGDEKYVSKEKLLQTLFNKKNYVVHYRVLQTYMKFGLKVTKVHSALKFQQSSWMKEYRGKYSKAKQMENIRKHMRVELLRTEEDKKIRHLANSL
ncbi:61_t:CDS:2, partial [Funneliformis geosporum]